MVRTTLTLHNQRIIGIISGLYTKVLNLVLIMVAQQVEPQTVLLWINDSAQLRLKKNKLCGIERAFKHTALNPLAIVNALLGNLNWKGGFVLLAMIFVLSGFLDNIAAAMIGGTLCGLQWLTFTYRYRRERQPARPAGFIKTALRPWKEKVCFKIKFTEE